MIKINCFSEISQLKSEQFLPITIDEAWAFFSSPKNLKKITPKSMGFDITSSNVDEEMYQGQIITYKVSPFAGIKTNWVTEITHVENKKYFVDEQRVGPYQIWHHEHLFKVVENGIKMKDIVTYKVPFGILGMILNKLFIKKRLKNIFEYRFNVLKEMFK